MAGRIPARPVNLPPASVSSFHTASDWLDHCLYNHPDCAQDNTGSKVLPTRVIDVGPSDGSKTPFLYTSNGRFGDWVTLSHCWGGIDPLKTLSETLEQHEKELPLKTLPPLFRDAVLITRRLNYRYLWIDSLCIIQDSESDWQNESSNMGYIYSNAILTIAAEAASNSRHSIFNGGERAVMYPVKISCHSDELKGSMMLYRARYDIKGPLSKRAWTLQEDVLSTRVLRWTSKQLTWHCRTVTCSEHDPTGAFNIDSKGYSSIEWLYRKSNLRLLGLPSQTLQRRLQDTRVPGSELEYRTGSLLPFWDAIVKDFASRSLTYETDRLPAVSGIAKEVARHTGYTYKAGLWKEEIHSELLWRVEGEIKKQTQYIAPSWSWAGHNFSSDNCKLANTSAQLRRYKSHVLAQILSIDVVPAGPDPFGQVSAGKLVLKALSLRMESLETLSSRFDCIPDGDLESSSYLLCLQILSFPTRQWFSALRSQNFEGEICALLLEPADETGSQYRRVGVARIPVVERGDGWEDRQVTVI